MIRRSERFQKSTLDKLSRPMKDSNEVYINYDNMERNTVLQPNVSHNKIPSRNSELNTKQSNLESQTIASPVDSSCSDILSERSDSSESIACGTQNLNKPLTNNKNGRKCFTEDERKANNKKIRQTYCPMPCDICHKVFRNNYQMKRHRYNQHISDNEYICNECSAVFRKRNLIINHVMIHMPPSFKCTVCLELFHTTIKLSNHLRTQHSIGNIKTYMCDNCGKIYPSKWALDNHMLIHEGRKPYVCELCGKNFRTATNLYQHTVSHSENRPFACNNCRKSFRLRHHLRQHMAVHGFKTTPKYGKRNKKNI